MGRADQGMTKRMGVVAVVVAGLVLVSWATLVSTSIDCATVTALISACSTFVTYGTPDPLPGSPCCDALMTLSNIGATAENQLSVCRCLMSLITNNPNATAIATLPGFCGVYLGFTMDPNTDCNYIS